MAGQQIVPFLCKYVEIKIKTCFCTILFTYHRKMRMETWTSCWVKPIPKPRSLFLFLEGFPSQSTASVIVDWHTPNLKSKIHFLFWVSAVMAVTQSLTCFCGQSPHDVSICRKTTQWNFNCRWRRNGLDSFILWVRPLRMWSHQKHVLYLLLLMFYIFVVVCCHMKENIIICLQLFWHELKR